MIEPYYTKMLELGDTGEDALLYGSGNLSAGVFSVGAVTAVSFSGPGAASVTAGVLTVVGEVWDILLSNGNRYPCAEGYGSEIFDVVNGDNLVGAGVTRDLQAKAHNRSFHWNSLVGWSEYSDGANIIRMPYLASGEINLSPLDASWERTGDYPYIDGELRQSETQVDFSYWRITAVPSGAVADYEAGDTLAPTDQMYARVSKCATVPWEYDRVIFTSTVPSAADILQLERYTRDGVACPNNLADSAPELAFNLQSNSQYIGVV